MSAAAPRTKVAVLGGGLGSLTTALYLTSTPELRERFDVTVYQMGWRLGGKGASGRNAAAGQRIEEHGLHMWMGWYQNAFRTIRAVYGEWEPGPQCPWADWTDAFSAQSTITFMDEIRGRWTRWTIDFPPNGETPGEGEIIDSVWDFMVMAIEWVEHAAQAAPLATPPAEAPERPGFLHRVLDDVLGALGGTHEKGAPGVHASLTQARRLARGLPVRPGARTDDHHRGILHLLEEFREWLRSSHGSLWKWIEGEVDEAALEFLDEHAAVRHAYVMADLAIAVFRGLWAEGWPELWEFDRFDDVDLRAWLAKHGASDMALRSGVLRSFYELGFCYVDGDPGKPAVAAGAGLRALIRMGLGYKGAVLFRMRAGMGDTIFTPMHDVLKARGVRFAFFTKVLNLALSDDRRSIERIDLSRQCELVDGTYDPFVFVNGLRCWPSEPLWDQIVDGERLRAEHVRFESHWSTHRGTPATLRRGEDFDVVVFGISLGSVPVVAKELLAQSARWRSMREHVLTVQTQAVQLWLAPNRRGLGWDGPPTVLTSYAEPLSTWADMSELIPLERWPLDQWPGSIAYLCGTMPGPREVPPPSDTGFPGAEEAKVLETAVTWLDANAAAMWPGAASRKGFDWSVVVDPGGAKGPARLRSQYWRANVDPSERYVQTVPGSTAHRLPSADAEFGNLFLAGDWVRSCINGGCVEGAVVGGMQASRAICGVPATIQGEGPQPAG